MWPEKCQRHHRVACSAVLCIDHIWNSSWVVGDFIWTSIDYIGESAIGSAATTPDLQASEGQPWNWHISFCGDIDIVGKQKAQSYYRTVLWDVSTIEMAVHRPMTASQRERVSGWGACFMISRGRLIFYSYTAAVAVCTHTGWPDEMQSWTWPGHEGESLAVSVFARCASGQVDLKLNGKAVASSPQPCSYATEFIAQFNVCPSIITVSFALSSFHTNDYRHAGIIRCHTLQVLSRRAVLAMEPRPRRSKLRRQLPVSC